MSSLSYILHPVSKEIDTKFSALVRAFRFGELPHGGIARKLKEWSKLRFVWAFPTNFQQAELTREPERSGLCDSDQKFRPGFPEVCKEIIPFNV
ncbi:unnamed protein product [Onchocerca ochengi]|uniref:Polymerase n=1 Tax=Onchocerca ochengi TaxID=42157 RepID=A0A182EAB0_ONCOC|nr:unnamed protein product [Onchocerca ochengi]